MEFWNFDFGFWILDFGVWNFGVLILDAGSWIFLLFEFGSWDLDFLILDSGSWILGKWHNEKRLFYCLSCRLISEFGILDFFDFGFFSPNY